MKLINALSQRILRLFLADIPAGACDALAGCCCNTLRTRRYSCYLSCVSGSCKLCG